MQQRYPQPKDKNLSDKKRTSYRSPYRLSMQNFGHVSSDTPFEPENRKRKNSLFKIKQPAPLKE